MHRFAAVLRDEPWRLFFPAGLVFLASALLYAIPVPGGDHPALRAVPWLAGGLFSLALGILLTETPRLLRVPPVGATPAAFLLSLLASLALSLAAGNRIMAHGVHLLGLLLSQSAGFAWILLSLAAGRVLGRQGARSSSSWVHP